MQSAFRKLGFRYALSLCVNLGYFSVFCSRISTNAAPLGLGSLVAARFYTNAVPPGLKRAFGIYTVCISDPARLQTAPTGLGNEDVFF